MRLEVRAVVDADLALSDVARFQDARYRYELHPNQDGLFSEMRISVAGAVGPVAKMDAFPDRSFRPRFILNDTGLAEELRQTLIYVESLGAMLLAIRKIHWDAATFCWLPESGEGQPDILSFSDPTITYPRTIHKFSPAMFSRVVRHRAGHEHLVVPFSFMRQGFNDYEAHRYITAFANFFLFLEHLYARGKTRRTDVLAAFESSSQLVAAVKEAIAKLPPSGPSDHLGNLERRLQSAGRRLDVKGALWLLYDVRGLLLHSSARSTRRGGSPLNHSDFRSEAFFAFSVVVHCQLSLTLGMHRVSAAGGGPATRADPNHTNPGGP